jgi:hypothetical protein
MGEIAKTLLKKAIESYQKDDGATKLGSFRDALTDICHMAYKSRAIKYTDDRLTDIHILLNNTFSILQEELETAEIDKVKAIPTKNLPLHIHDTYEFDSAREIFTDQLKRGNPRAKNHAKAATQKKFM